MVLPNEKRRAPQLVFSIVLVIIFINLALYLLAQVVTNYFYCKSKNDFKYYSHGFTSSHANESDDNIYIIIHFIFLFIVLLSKFDQVILVKNPSGLLFDFDTSYLCIVGN